MSLVESQHILQGPHQCSVCTESSNATTICMQCDVKLCYNCLHVHNQLPASRNHVTEDLSKLTRRLAEAHIGNCKTHSDRLAELFCPIHQELICILCATTSHGNCQNKKIVEDAAEEKRAELKWRSNRMILKEREFDKKIQEAIDMFKVIRMSAKETFDDLQKQVWERRRQVERDIQRQEEAVMRSLMSFRTSRGSCIGHARTVEHLMDNAPGGVIFALYNNLTSRLDQIEGHHDGKTPVDIVTLHWQQDHLSTLRDLLAQLGEVRTSTAGSPGQLYRGIEKPRGAELARVIKVGDRVRRGPHWDRGNQDGGGPGTVTWVGDGVVSVRWDKRLHSGRQYDYRMGDDNLMYDLDLL